MMMKSEMHNPAFNSWHGPQQTSSPASSSSSGSTPSNTPPDSLFRRHHSQLQSQQQFPARGSLRKMLPPTPDMDTQMSLSAKMIDRRTSTPKGNHSYGPFFLEYSLLAEFNLLQKQKMPGVYVIPSAHSPLCWFGVIFVRQGIYQEGVFRFKLVIPDNYPDGDCPRLIFDHFVYHPIVSPETFELDLRRGFHKWKRNVNHIWQILLYARRIFYKIETTDALNKEAAETYNSDPAAYQIACQACVDQWKERLFDSGESDPHYISFSPYDRRVHEPVVKAMMESANKNPPSSCSPPDSGQNYSLSSTVSSSSLKAGLSYVEPGTLQVFSRDHS